jgi:hypothetical protein
MRRVLTLLAAVALTACVNQSRPETCDEPSATLELTLTAQALSPTRPAVCQDQKVTLVVHSEVDGTLHIHGYDEAVPATEVTDGEDLHLEFTATRTGQFSIELHTDAAPQGVAVGIFTVHDR